MEIVKLKVTDVLAWENNARIHTKRNLEALKNSLKAFGQTKPILVQKGTNRIIAGNGTYAAICALGWDSVDCHILDLDDTKAEALAIADNKTGLLSEWNESVLTESLKKLQETGDLELTGYDNLDLEKMMSFQDGSAFEKLTPKKEMPQKPEPEQEKTEEKTAGDEPIRDFGEPDIPEPTADAVPYDEQLSFTLCGFIFSCADRFNVNEIRSLMKFLKDDTADARMEANEWLFENLKQYLSSRYMR